MQERLDARQDEIYVTEIREASERVATRPDRGHMVDEIREGYWRYVTGSHLMFYVECDHGIDVIRILHQRIDPTLYL